MSMPYPPLGLYIHIPWCVRKCPYCDFNSHQMNDQLDEAGYIDALLADLAYELADKPDVESRPLATLFIGGGTPSLFSADGITRLLQGVRERMACCESMEITLEANPGTVELARFSGYYAAGVNRLSLGIQSFNSDSLQRLGRIHGRNEALAAIVAARQAGFDRLNLDLMCGLPGQTLDMVMADVDVAIASEPDHISYYQLTLEPNTPFYNRPPELFPDDDAAFGFQDHGRQALKAAGYEQYEVSAYARNGSYCRHNVNYWQFGDYLGIGAGAHSKITLGDPWSVMRSWRVRSPARYLESAGTSAAVAGVRSLSDDDLVMEFMMNALRLKRGFPATLFTECTGLEQERLYNRVEEAQNRGLLQLLENSIVTTDLGWRFLDDTVAVFMD